MADPGLSWGVAPDDPQHRIHQLEDELRRSRALAEIRVQVPQEAGAWLRTGRLERWLLLIVLALLALRALGG